MLASEIFQAFASTGLITAYHGPDQSFARVEPVETCNQHDLVFADHERYLDLLIQRRPAIVVTTAKLAEPLQAEGLTVLVSGNVKLAHALIRQRYTDTPFWQTEWSRIHASAVIHESVVVPDDCVIGPGVVIGAGVQLAGHVVVMANTTIEHDARIGRDCIIHPNVVLGWGCELGERVVLQSGSIIGAEGYGFAQDEARHSYRIPQQGIVVLESDVTIGACSCIDRATYTETRIKRGVKIDNLCHIAHNVVVGEDSLLTAQTVIAGSTTLGDRVICSGQTGILDHLTIAHDVVLLHRAGVTQNVDAPGYYAALPLQPLSTYMKNAVIQKKLNEMHKKVRQLEKQVAELLASRTEVVPKSGS